MATSNNAKEIRVDENSPLFDKIGMLHKEFPSDFRQIRYFTLLIVQSAPPDIKEINLLEQQISEVIKNAVKHGNKCDHAKKVRVWYSFSAEHAHLIVEDEGEGFKDLEKWNKFNRRRSELLEKQDFEALADYVSYRGEAADENDGGNALFAALEYWNGGFVFNQKRNCVSMLKRFPKKRMGVAVDGEPSEA
jgi:serine/threonine-protein kinase RsbW